MTMATTKIWAIKDSLSRVVNYAKNPEKTIFSDLKQVLKYAENDEKTIDICPFCRSDSGSCGR